MLQLLTFPSFSCICSLTPILRIPGDSGAELFQRDAEGHEYPRIAVEKGKAGLIVKSDLHPIQGHSNGRQLVA